MQLHSALLALLLPLQVFISNILVHQYSIQRITNCRALDSFEQSPLLYLNQPICPQSMTDPDSARHHRHRSMLETND
jgi:hypothetical protein